MVTVRLTFDKELDLEVSVRQGKRESFWAGVLDEEDGSCCDDGVAPEEFGVVPAALEKKLRMLCCLPVEWAVIEGWAQALIPSKVCVSSHGLTILNIVMTASLGRGERKVTSVSQIAPLRAAAW
jgi:hypothetical protein